MMTLTAYEKELYDFIQPLENAGKLTGVHDDNKGIPTLGTGYALVIKVNGDWVVRPNFRTDLEGVGITVPSDLETRLDSVAKFLNGDTINGQEFQESNFTDLSISYEKPDGNPSQDEQLFDLIYKEYEGYVSDQFVEYLGYLGIDKTAAENLFNNLSNDKKIALTSLSYNSPSLIGNGLSHAIYMNDDVMAWFEIRYVSNYERIIDRPNCQGIAKRRYIESSKFFDTSMLNGTSLDQFWAFLENMDPHNPSTYPTIKDRIMVYENDSLTSPKALFDNNLGDHRVKITRADGSIGLVTFGTNSADSFIQDWGDSNNDIFIAGEGNDTLKGGAGADLLYGEEGGDTYVFTNDDVTVFDEVAHILDTVVEKASDDSIENDTLDFSAVTHKLNIDLNNPVEFININNDLTGIENVIGGQNNDTITGNAKGNVLIGGKSNDELYGGEGYDTYVFEKGDGQDVIIDSDGKGKIVIKNPGKKDITLYGTTDLPYEEGKWKDKNGVIYQWSGNDLVTAA